MAEVEHNPVSYPRRELWALGSLTWRSARSVECGGRALHVSGLLLRTPLRTPHYLPVLAAHTDGLVSARLVHSTMPRRCMFPILAELHHLDLYLFILLCFPFPQALLDAGIAAPGRLAADCLSAGGWAVGAALNLEPDLFACAVFTVASLDVLTNAVEERYGRYELGHVAEDAQVCGIRRMDRGRLTE